jgi:AcrR family transcriptional regulator
VLQESATEAKRLYRILLEYLLSRTDEPVVDRIRELLQVVGESFAADDVFMESVVTETNLFCGSTGDAATKDHANFALLAELFRQGQERGEVSRELEPIQLAEMLTAVYMLTITNWLIRWWGERDDLGSRLSQAMDVFFEGCRSREE